MFSEIPETKSTEQQRVVVDICYTIGGSALKAGQYGTAATWLGRALKVCETWSNDEIPAVAQSLRDKKLLALHAYARSNLHLTTAVFETQLRKTIDLLRTEYGDSFPVLVFSLEVLNKDALNEEYFTTLKSSTKEMDNDGTNVEIIFHYVMKLGCLG
ncbi:meiosis specific protein SPO22 [Aspergillus fruticulosus]